MFPCADGSDSASPCESHTNQQHGPRMVRVCLQHSPTNQWTWLPLVSSALQFDRRSSYWASVASAPGEWTARLDRLLSSLLDQMCLSWFLRIYPELSIDRCRSKFLAALRLEAVASTVHARWFVGPRGPSFFLQPEAGCADRFHQRCKMKALRLPYFEAVRSRPPWKTTKEPHGFSCITHGMADLSSGMSYFGLQVDQ